MRPSTPAPPVVDPELERSLRQYALGALTDDERLDVEARLITNPETCDRLGVIEQELAEDYLDGALSADERRRFERCFLASVDHRDQLELVRGLRVAATAAASPHATSPASTFRRWMEGWFQPLSPVRVAYASSLALLAGALVWSMTSQRQLQTELVGLRAERARQQSAASRASTESIAEVSRGLAPSDVRPAATPSSPPSAETVPAGAAPLSLAVSVPTFVLAAPALQRGEGSLTRVAIPASAPVVRFLLHARGEPYASYRVVVYDGNADERVALSGLGGVRSAEGGHTVVVVLPSEQLSRGDYQLKLGGVTPDGQFETLASYTVRVTRP
jgi:hypothetical protein